jgi:predicted unusual protein kinase regulating ubiquinone biosynthesis (AarF/ABC1/UbiB family)
MPTDDQDPTDKRLARLAAELREASAREVPSRGLGRTARLLRGAAGLAVGTWSARRRAASGELEDADLARIEQLVARLGELKGLPMKIGQVLGYLEADLPAPVQQLLSLLQTQSQPMPFERIESALREALGSRAEALLAKLERSPVSVASIGQVHRGALPDGTPVAVKVRHPDIEQAIRSDFNTATTGLAFAKLIVPAAGTTAKEAVGEARARLLEECDYELEARRQILFGRLHAGHPDIVVPRVCEPWCAAQVLTTSWEDGRLFDRFHPAATQAERDRVGGALFELYIGTLYRGGWFHADPHPGNYAVREDGRLVVFDYGCVRQFDAPTVAAFVQLGHAVREDDAGRIRDALVTLGAEPPRNGRAFAQVRQLLRGFFGPLLIAGTHRIDGRIAAANGRQLFRDKLAVGRLRLPGKLLFLFRIRFGLFSVLSRLGAARDWSAMERAYAEHAMQ